MNFQDIISLSIIGIYIIPILLYFKTGNPIHIKASFGAFTTSLISEFIKRNIIENKSPRPEGALNCNLLCNDGKQSGKPGMPSSHTASIVFFTTYYFNKVTPLMRIFLIGYSGIIMLSRYLKQCHTINQIGGGALIGFIFGILVRN
jgi:hypothetical protein